MKPFDVAVVGGGLAGAASAYELSRHKLSVALLERKTCAAEGASAVSGGIVRVYDGDPELAALARGGAQHWAEWRLGTPVPFEACGVVQILPEAEEDSAREIVGAVAGEGYPIELLSPAQASRRFAWFPAERRDSCLVLHEPRGGFGSPRFAARLYAEAARRNGVLVLEGLAASDIEPGAGTLSLALADGRLEARVVVIACGAWSSRWLPGAGLTARRIQLSLIAEPAGGPGCCVVDDVGHGYFGRSLGGLAFIGSGAPPAVEDLADPLPPSPGRRARHLDFFEELTGLAPQPLGEVVGIDAYTADLRPLVGFAEADPRLFGFTGFSGRGAKYIPFVAERAAGQLAQALRG